MASLRLRMAIDRYDRHFPFFDGTVSLGDDVELEVLQVGQSGSYRDGTERHRRMLEGQEFDVCEFSLSTYLLARERGLPIVGVPVFPRRLFSASQMFVHAASAIESPRDLEGRRVGISSFQTTFSVLSKGDLKFEYGVPWENIVWCTTDSEKVAFDLKPGVVIEPILGRAELGPMLEEGRIDALILPNPLNTFMAGGRQVRRLFRDAQAEELRYFRKYGYYPIMHLITIREQLIEREPWLAGALMEGFARAKAIAAGYFEDPNWSRLAWGRRYFEEERTLIGPDPWPDGVAANRENLSRFIAYSVDQGLLKQPLSVESLFPEQVHDS